MLEIFVNNYSLRPEGNAENIFDHLFSIKLCIEGNEFELSRSYGSFCALQTKLKSVYPTTSLPAFPLPIHSAFAHEISSSSTSSKVKNSAMLKCVGDGLVSAKSIYEAARMFDGDKEGGNEGDSMMSTWRDSGSGTINSAANRDSKLTNTIRTGIEGLDNGIDFLVENTSALQRNLADAALQKAGILLSGDAKTLLSSPTLLLQQTAKLQVYLRELLGIPEIINSESISSFLDGESNDGELLDFQKLCTEQVSVVDVLLFSAGYHKHLILPRRDKVIDRTVSGEQVLVWSFRLNDRFDVGYSVLYNKTQELVSYSRVTSHNKNTNGIFEGNNTSRVAIEIKFDNSYSKLRSKNVYYSLGIFSKIEYMKANALAMEANKIKAKMMKERALLHDAISLMSQEIVHRTGATLNPNLMGKFNNNAHMSMVGSNKDEDVIQRLKEEKESIVHSYEETLNILQDARKSLSETREKVDEVEQSKEFLENQLLMAETASELLKEKLIAKDQEIAKNQDVVMQSITDTKESKEEISRLSRLLEVYTTKLESSNATIKKMEESHAELSEALSNTKNEKKQLKQYAKQTRSELEEVNKLKKEIDMLKIDVQQKDKELETLQLE